MSTTTHRAPAPAGARPVKRRSPKCLSTAALRKLGSYVLVKHKDLDEGDIVLYENSSYCVTHKDFSIKAGSLMTFRELGTHVLRKVRFEPRSRVSRLRMPDYIPGEYGNWRIRSGDVVLYPGKTPAQSVAAIRHTLGWFRTAAPWTPLADAEVVLDLREQRAFLIRADVRQGGVDPDRGFTLGCIVASRDVSKEPSVWLRVGINYWVSNSRGADASDVMIRYELGRGTYQFLRLPEKS